MTSQLLSNCSGLRSAGAGFQPRRRKLKTSTPLFPYPLSFSECRAWARAAGVPEDIALRRFIAYSVLRCIAASPELNRRLILRGGCALWLRYGGRRPFDDIDFLCPDLPAKFDAATDQSLTDSINDALSRGLFGYFPQEPKWEPFLLDQIKIEVANAAESLPCQRIALGTDGRLAIRVADLERILAEKLTALLQHADKKKKRGKDVADIAVMMRAHGDRVVSSTVKTILAQFALRRHLQFPVKRSRFEGQIRQVSMETYEMAIPFTSEPELGFEAAWAEVMELVRRVEESV
jgi:predicted nucleotidyltransferase component of viral defense system